MSILNTSNYSDFKSATSSKHFKDIFYYDNDGSIFIVCAIGDNGFTYYSNNLTTQPVSFSTDFPTAVQLTNIFTVT